MFKPIRKCANCSFKKRAAIILLAVWMVELLRPATALALTSGPVQPEAQGFQPAGVSDMVDLQSGDFKYNLPLLDIDGYPLNLSYQSGSGMEDEASWVGFGWSLNPGVINRQVRGIADDMKGDNVETVHYTKPMVTIGGRMTAKTEVFGFGLVGLSGSVNYGAYINNYTGIGAEVGANAGISLSRSEGGMMTGALGFGISSDSQKGVDASPYASLSMADSKSSSLVNKGGLTASLGYNSRSGMKSLSLGASFGNTSLNSYNVSISGMSYNTEPISPRIQIPYLSSTTSFSIDAGFTVGVFAGAGFTGYRSEKKVMNNLNTNPSYGFLYAEKGKNEPEAIMDFLRENENPIIPELKNLALPIATPDVFSYSSQVGSGQFRLYRGGSGVFFDNLSKDLSENTSFGADFGASLYGFHGGVTFFQQDINTTTGKWTMNNQYASYGDFQDEDNGSVNKQHVYFRTLGEMSLRDENMAAQLNYTSVLTPKLSGNTATQNFHEKSVATPITKNVREINGTTVSYLTAVEAENAGLEKVISIYDFNKDGNPTQLPRKPDLLESQPRVVKSTELDQRRNAHHISEITVTQNSGKRLVYGIPVYNTKQVEYSFAIGDKSKGDYVLMDESVPTLAKLQGALGTIDGKKGIDHYYHKESKPPYATAYLLSAILSPDYVDRTMNGITDDDLGTAIKFNYSRLPKYRWRTPYAGATINRALLADPDDDKASIIYGEKEIYYINSIESKTKIAYFITKDREDALGVLGWQGGKDPSQKQKCLTEIRLYSKADMSKPIKVVKFRYNYSICPGLPNQSGAVGKLTLERVWFEYSNVDKGKFNPYVFYYKDAATPYAYASTDRWGTYKPQTGNYGNLSNEEFPYSTQDKTVADQRAGIWQLNAIELPTGGKIEVVYEADDYNYVQNRKAMTMQSMSLVGGTGDPERALIEADGIKIAIPHDYMPPPEALTSSERKLQWFKNNFLSGSDYLYTKINVKIADNDTAPKDFISCYVQVTGVDFDDNNNTAIIRFDNITDGGETVNPMIIAAWQKMKNEYPRYAYPGYDNRRKADLAGSISGLVMATINAVGNVAELLKPFYSRAKRNGMAGKYDPDKSFVRLTKYAGAKIGGGSRVKRVLISDDWASMSEYAGGDALPTANYGQEYEYKNEDGSSSGVAAYEPSIGNDENPFKQPVFYTQKIKGAINNYMSLEEPFGESLFPAPGIIYSRVKVANLNKDKVLDETYRTGYTVHEFYTSKDFSVKVKQSAIQSEHYKPDSYFSFIKTVSDDELYMSQGYVVELNDMNGKTRATKVFNQANALVSGTEYFYKCNKEGAGQYSLNNDVKVVAKNGTVSNSVLGQDIEMFTDYREQESINKGKTVNIGADVFFFVFAAVVLPHVPSAQNDDYRRFRSACALKTIQSYGILDRVVRTENGSSVTTQNVAFDGVTGQALITETKNEFNGDIYNVNIPAYWGYEGMGPAAKNLGLILSGLTTDGAGRLTNYETALDNGDELVDLHLNNNNEIDGQRFWVISQQVPISGQIGGYYSKKFLVDKNGNVARNFAPDRVKVIRAGDRNILEESITTIVCLNNPITADNKLRVSTYQDLTSLRVINSSAKTFDENWYVEQPEYYDYTTPNTAYNWDIVRGDAPQWYLQDVQYNMDVPYYNGHVFLPDNPLVYSNYSNENYTGPQDDFLWEFLMHRIKPYPFHPNANPFNILSVYDSFIVEDEKDYYLALGGNFMFEVLFDDNICQVPGTTPTVDLTPENYNLRFKKIHLTAGEHKVRYDFHNWTGLVLPSEFSRYNKLLASLIIYDNTLEELTPPVAPNVFKKIYTSDHILHTTNQMINTSGGGSGQVAKYANDVGIDPSGCTPPGINPYLFGFKGNWRFYQSKVYQQSRVYNGALNPKGKGLDVKSAGYINHFYPNWYYDQPSAKWVQFGYASRWTVANTVTRYDKYGQELENVDALGRASTAKFDFNGQLPSAIASNALHREIYNQTFEEAKFLPASNTALRSGVREFLISGELASLSAIDTKSHSGNYSLLLPVSGVFLPTIINAGEAKPDSYLSVDEQYRFIKNTAPGHYPKGFEPSSGKDYLFTAWIRDGQPHLKNANNLSLQFNGSSVALQCKAIVEGWKLVEGIIQIPSSFPVGRSIALKISPVGSNVYIDDIRIHPKQAQMKTYAYDDKTMRLMAELDENALATFYEYDDQGLLVRVKKETERGIMTLKESRSAYKKKL